jgi:hypothetical protein
MATVNIGIVEVGDSSLEVNLPPIQRGEAEYKIEETDTPHIGEAVANAINRLDLDQAIVIWLEEA